ncbi:MAG: 4-hydroxy-tetrahydrodipicolinate reductase [Aquabacterium sp.]
MPADQPLRIAVAGASGRMGRMLIDAIAAAPDCTLGGALDITGSPALGQDAGAYAGRHTGVPITDDLRQGLGQADVLIDFTRPEGTLAHLEACAQVGVGMVIGTTGFSPPQRERIADHARRHAVVLAPNMSVGVNVLLGLLARAAPALQGYDIEIVETHHQHKVDAPSGTALKMGEVIARAQGHTLDEVAHFARHGQTGERRPGSIGFAALRGGDIVGDHTVLFAGPGERLEFTHRSSSRANYADGALRAARFLRGRSPGLYGMDHVLGL